MLQTNPPLLLRYLAATFRTLLLPGKRETLRVLEGETMGTSWSARFFAPPQFDDAKYLKAIEQELQIVVEQMSHWCSDSDLSRFNCSPTGFWQSLPLELCRVLDFALKVARESSGAFDPTVGRMVDEWGFGPKPKDPRQPCREILTALQRSGGWTHVELDLLHRVARHSGNPSLDLSAVAKGFAVDQMGRLLSRLGISSYLVEIGGELRAGGLKPGHEPWWVAIERPGEVPEGFPEIRVALSGWSIATSGDYRRYFESQGRRWTHTIDPRTGYALGPGVAQVSVIHADCMAADAYSTALTVLGAKEGLDFAERLGLAAVFVLRSHSGLEVRCTERFYRMTEQTEEKLMNSNEVCA